MGLPAKNDFFLEGLLLCCNPQKINAARSIERDCFLGMGYGNLKDGLAEHINYFQGLCIGWQVFDSELPVRWIWKNRVRTFLAFCFYS